MKCDWVKQGEDSPARYKCSRCRFLTAPTRRGPDKIRAPECRAMPRYWEIGGWLEVVFEIVALDKGRYLWLKSRLGLAPSCGCQQRAAVLNTLGSRLNAAIGWLYAKIGKLFTKRG